MSEKDVEALKKDVQKILSYLHNDDETGEKGLVAQVRIMQKDFNEFTAAYKTEQAVKKAKIGLLGTIGGFIGGFLLWVAEKIVEHIHF